MAQATVQEAPGQIQPRTSPHDKRVGVIFDDRIANGPYTVASKHDRCPENESPHLRAILDSLEDQELPDGAIAFVEVHRYGLNIHYRLLTRKRKLKRAVSSDPRSMIETLVNDALAGSTDL
jgi:hypothetical protein